MDALFIAGGESLVLHSRQRSIIRQLGVYLAPMPWLLRLGPTKGEVVHALCEGLLSSSNRNVQVLIELPVGITREMLEPSFLQLGPTIVPSTKDRDHRNTNQIEESKVVLVLPGESKTYAEALKATDKDKPTVVFDIGGRAVDLIREETAAQGKVTYVRSAQEGFDFVRAHLHLTELAAGA
ncbi:MAG: hypothetical protein Q8P13_04410 [bacterium]|nr:hypothetical protein [bacterium]